ncbi:hypothetical protein ACP275_13G050100 [Erythranthe tilingii]
MNELMAAVVPFLDAIQSLPSTSGIPIPIDANPLVVSDTIAQDDLWDALEQENWKQLSSSREYKLIERHREQCEAMIKSIAGLLLLQQSILDGTLGMAIEDPTDIDRATSVVFDDLFDRFDTHQKKRKNH